MNNQSNKIIAIVALVLFSIKGRAQVNNLADEEKINGVFSEIQKASKDKPMLLNQLMLLKKFQFENTVSLDLTDAEFKIIRQLIGELLNAGVNAKIVSIKDMVIATQEFKE